MIVLIETWQNDFIEFCKLTGYKGFLSSNGKNRSSGVAIFVCNTMNVLDEKGIWKNLLWHPVFSITSYFTNVINQCPLQIPIKFMCFLYRRLRIVAGVTWRHFVSLAILMSILYKTTVKQLTILTSVFLLPVNFWMESMLQEKQKQLPHELINSWPLLVLRQIVYL